MAEHDAEVQAEVKSQKAKAKPKDEKSTSDWADEQRKLMAEPMPEAPRPRSPRGTPKKDPEPMPEKPVRKYMHTEASFVLFYLQSIGSVHGPLIYCRDCSGCTVAERVSQAKDSTTSRTNARKARA